MGQQRRVNLSLTFAFSDLAIELSHETFNVMFLDEIFDNIDSANIEIVLDILNEKAKRGMEIIFISHNGNFNNHQVNRKITIENDHGFSVIK
jgi:DNA repair exonuclease SbcCD ATPase subunit